MLVDLRELVDCCPVMNSDSERGWLPGETQGVKRDSGGGGGLAQRNTGIRPGGREMKGRRSMVGGGTVLERHGGWRERWVGGSGRRLKETRSAFPDVGILGEGDGERGEGNEEENGVREGSWRWTGLRRN